MKILLISSLSFIFVTILLANQFFFICKNITTSEFKRNKYGSGVYPFDKGGIQNLRQFWSTITSYRRDITYHISASRYLELNSLVEEETKKRKSKKENLNNLEMSLESNYSKTL